MDAERRQEEQKKNTHISLLQRLHKCLRDSKKRLTRTRYRVKTTDGQRQNILRSTKKRRRCESIANNLRSLKFLNDSVHADVCTFSERKRVRETYCVFSVFFPFEYLSLLRRQMLFLFNYSINQWNNG